MLPYSVGFAVGLFLLGYDVYVARRRGLGIDSSFFVAVPVYEKARGKQNQLSTLFCLLVYLKSDKSDSRLIVKTTWYYPVSTGVFNAVMNLCVMLLATSALSPSLIYPVYRSTTGTGRTWYTTWAEHDRYIYYQRSGNRTTEYYQCERYDDHDAYIAPWLPNASANGRVLDMLFDYYGSKKLN